MGLYCSLLGVLLLFAFDSSQGQYCCKECFQVCLDIFDKVPSPYFNNLATYMRYLKGKREMANSKSTNYLMDSTASNALVWHMQKTLAASTAIVLIQDEKESCNPMTLSQYGENVAWGYSLYQCQPRCKAAQVLQGLSSTPETPAPDGAFVGCVNTLFNIELPFFTPCVKEAGMLLAFTNSNDQTVNFQCAPFYPRIATAVQGYTLNFYFHYWSIYWENHFWPTLWLKSCLNHRCCQGNPLTFADDFKPAETGAKPNWSFNFRNSRGQVLPNMPLSNLSQTLGIPFDETDPISEGTRRKLLGLRTHQLRQLEQGVNLARREGIDVGDWEPEDNINI